MSAYIVDYSTIDKLVAFALRKPSDRFYVYNPIAKRWAIDPNSTPTAETVGQVLVNQNYRSFNDRYSEFSDAPEYRFSGTTSLVAKSPVSEAKPIEVLKAANCLDYQSCETDDYHETDAYWILDAIKNRAIRALPGYDAADWG